MPKSHEIPIKSHEIPLIPVKWCLKNNGSEAAAFPLRPAADTLASVALAGAVEKRVWSADGLREAAWRCQWRCPIVKLVYIW